MLSRWKPLFWELKEGEIWLSLAQYTPSGGSRSIWIHNLVSSYLPEQSAQARVFVFVLLFVHSSDGEKEYLLVAFPTEVRNVSRKIRA